MKKALAVLVLLAALGVCSPAFADYVLLYNLNIAMKGVDANNDNAAVNIPLKAYLILTESDEGVLVDANLILYGKDPISKAKVFTILNQTDENTFLSATQTELGEFQVIDLFANTPFGFEILLICPIKSINIGTETNQEVAAGGKGVILSFSDLVLSDTPGAIINPAENIAGTGNVNGSLLAGPTRNINLDLLTAADVIEEIRDTKLITYTEVIFTVEEPL